MADTPYATVLCDSIRLVNQVRILTGDDEQEMH